MLIIIETMNRILIRTGVDNQRFIPPSLKDLLNDEFSSILCKIKVALFLTHPTCIKYQSSQ